jgi:hypothetical protein
MGSQKIAEGTSSRLWLVVIQALAAPLTMSVVPFFALLWFEQRKKLGLFVLSAAIPVVYGVLVGRDFQIALTAIVIFCAWLISRVRRRHYFSWKDAAVFGAAGAFFLVVFVVNKLARSATPTVAFCPPGAAHCVSSGAPTLWDSIVVLFSSYASQSFEGLGRALEGTWSFGGGFAHSPALAQILQPILGHPASKTITDQLAEHNWSATAYWSTGLTWLANDVPWVGVPFVVALQAILLAFAWKRAIRSGDWLSTTVFGYTWLSLFFMMQNLQLAISGPIYFGYIVLVAAYLVRAVRSRPWKRQLGPGPKTIKAADISQEDPDTLPLRAPWVVPRNGSFLP